ncbi:MAG: hypothetical protein NTX15_04690 [Candidatus Kapabacteria bacterium]|nr:hypothetical protein [Candidatus Kapabacteria bacterium]
MLHPSISSRYTEQRKIYTRLLRLCFTLAGLYWIAIYMLPLEKHAPLRAGQSVIYFILMTLWGLDYQREQKRLTVIINAANAKAIPPCEVEYADVVAHNALFTMITFRRGFWGVFVPLLFGLGLATSIVLLILQYTRLIVSF